MAAHIERMERFENAIFKQREGINSRMTEMFGLLKELMTNRTLEKVLIRKEAKFPVTKNVNSISLKNGEEEWNNKKEVTPDNTERSTETEAEIPLKKAETKNKAKNEAKNKSIKTPENEEEVEAPDSQPIAYYLKHKINEKLIEGLVDNNRFNNSLSRTRVGKKKGKTYKVLPRGPVYDAILKKKIMKKEDIGGNFKIPCNIEGQKGINALVDQGSDMNVMPYTTYMKLTDERPAKTGIRLSLSSHSYIYPLGIAEDVLVEEEKIKLHLEKEMKFNQWRSKSLKGKHPTIMATKEEIDDEEELTLYLMRRSLEVIRKFHWMILGGQFN
ncbi:hypothetical protein Tco_1397844 [Tanacetum coccineum]